MSTFKAANVDNLFASDAEWRTYCQAVESAILASGFLVAASDTGQVDLTSASRPSISSYAGYKIYRTNDALHATYPMYVKVEYGVGAAITRPLVRWTFGHLTNGAGTLTGNTKTAATVHAPTVDGAGSQQIWGGGGDSDMWVYLYDPSAASCTSFFAMGRMLDPVTGDAEGGVIWASETNSGTSAIFGSLSWTDSAGVFASVSGGPTIFFPDIMHALNTGGDITKSLLYQGTLYRAAKTLVFPFLTGRLSELAFATDPDVSTFALDIWAANRTFSPLPQIGMHGSSERVAHLWTP